MIPDVYNKKKLNSLVIDLFIRCRKTNISFAVIAQLYFKVPKNVRLNTAYFFIMKIPNKQELEQIAYNHSSDIDFMNLYKKCTAKSYSFLVIDVILASDNPSHFRKNVLERI